MMFKFLNIFIVSLSFGGLLGLAMVQGIEVNFMFVDFLNLEKFFSIHLDNTIYVYVFISFVACSIVLNLISSIFTNKIFFNLLSFNNLALNFFFGAFFIKYFIAIFFKRDFIINRPGIFSIRLVYDKNTFLERANEILENNSILKDFGIEIEDLYTKFNPETMAQWDSFVKRTIEVLEKQKHLQEKLDIQQSIDIKFALLNEQINKLNELYNWSFLGISHEKWLVVYTISLIVFIGCSMYYFNRSTSSSTSSSNSTTASSTDSTTLSISPEEWTNMQIRIDHLAANVGDLYERFGGLDHRVSMLHGGFDKRLSILEREMPHVYAIPRLSDSVYKLDERVTALVKFVNAAAEKASKINP